MNMKGEEELADIVGKIKSPEESWVVASGYFYKSTNRERTDYSSMQPYELVDNQLKNLCLYFFIISAFLFKNTDVTNTYL